MQATAIIIIAGALIVGDHGPYSRAMAALAHSQKKSFQKSAV